MEIESSVQSLSVPFRILNSQVPPVIPFSPIHYQHLNLIKPNPKLALVNLFIAQRGHRLLRLVLPSLRHKPPRASRKKNSAMVYSEGAKKRMVRWDPVLLLTSHAVRAVVDGRA